MLRKRLIVSLFFITIFTFCSVPVILSQQQPQEETITITTYYPAPFGVYKGLRLFPSERPSNPKAGDMYFDNGEGEYSRGLYYYDGAQWILVTGATEPVKIGEVYMADSLEEFQATRQNLFEPKKSHTPYYRIDNWVRTSDSYEGFKLISPFKIQIDTWGDDLNAGNYQIVYGGGTIDFAMGTRYEVRLYEGVRIIDNYYIDNPAVEDCDEQCKFWQGEVDIEERQTTIYIPNRRRKNIELRIIPRPVPINDEQIAPRYRLNEHDQWVAAGSPVFEITPGYDCNPGMREDLCGSNPNPNPPVGGFNDYMKSWHNMYILNRFGGGTVRGVRLEVWKLD